MTYADIDSLYEEFCNGLPPEVRETARSLAFELKLAPRPDVPWSDVFKHRVTLEAPTLVCEGIPIADVKTGERAVLAHMLAVIGAFGTDRIADEQVEDKPELRRILECTRAARDKALFEIRGPDALRIAENAELRTRSAIETERELLGRGKAVDFETYEAVSTGKQSVGLPASIVLAQAAGLPTRNLDAVGSMLTSVALGLQFKDDVFDWEEDARRGGAWAPLLARRSQSVAPDVSNPERLTRFVESSGVLTSMLALSAGRFQSALADAELLGAAELARWLLSCCAETLDLCERERKSPGYVRRMKQLAPWAAEVGA